MMKYLQYGLLVFAARLLFTLGSAFAMLFVFPLFSGSTFNIHEDTIREIELKIGMQCTEVYPEAMEFV